MRSRLTLLIPLTFAITATSHQLVGAQQTASAWVMRADAPENAALRNLRWRGIGPANPGGRITVVAGLPGNTNTFYVAGAAGGIIKTTNGGTTWTPIFDDQPVASIGAISVANSNENILWVGTGEGDPRNSTSFGNGVYRSADAGRTWSYLGLEDTERIKRIAVHPANPDVAYVCALGHAWGPNEQRGVFRTTDAGKTWSKVLYKNTTTGCSDIAMDPSDPKTLYAGMYTHLRRPWRFDSGSGETALYKTTDGGDTWKKLTNGLPTEPLDRPGVAVSLSNPNVVYLITETKSQGTFFRSDDRGETWKKMSDNTVISFRPFYYDDIRVDPANPDRVFALAGQLQVSNDAGRTWANAGAGTHGDHQAMWIDPKNPSRILEGSDGGFQISNDGAATWEVVNNFSFAQFYHVSYDLQRPYTLCGGLQDNGTWCGPSMTTSSDGIRKRDWATLSGGDGFEGVQNIAQPWLVYSNSQGGQTYVNNTRTNTSRQNPPYPKDLSSTGSAVAGYKYRFNWNTPIVRSPHDPRKIYLGGNVLFSSINHGQSWTVLSPDLTTNDKSKQQSSGGEIVTDNTAAEFHCTILAIAESPITPGVIWVGTDDGNLQITRDGGKTWKNVVGNIPGLPANSWIPNIDASPFAAGEAYVAVDRHRDNDFAPHAYKTTDYGQTWTPISSNLPAKGYVHVVRSDIKQRGLLFLGTELGPYASWNDGASWVSLRNGLAAAPVVEMVVQPATNDLVIATHGRGIYILDNIQPLRQLAAAMKADAFLFDGPAAIRWQTWGRDGSLGAKEYTGQNPPTGGMIDFYLKNAGAAKITIGPAAGKAIRTLNVNAQAGVNRTMWDLRYDATSTPSTAAGPAGGGGGGGGGRGGGRGGGGGPYVLPGTYTVTLSAAGQTLTRSIRVQMDPRITVTALDLQTQLDAGLKLREMAEKINAMIAKADDVVRQLTDAAATNPAARAALEQAKARRFQMGRLPGEQGYRIQGRLREDIQGLAGSIGQNPGPPTAGEIVRLKEVTGNLAETLADWDRFLKSIQTLIK
ncbi:MAG: hypothetical protein EPO35_06990 [Acidobacteria bacterium]|nr:MAG: hypothetical protein EPO35_06990 [Acidobacteriota bacterium]